MELRHLRYFVAVGEELSFTRAARRLHTAQPSLSQQIRHLEREVGVPLLERDRRTVRLTPAGRAFLAEAAAILDRVNYAARLAVKVSSGGAGELSVGTFPAADVKILPRLRTLLASRLPDLRLVFHSRYAVEPLSGLRHGMLDVAFVRGPVADAGLEAIELLREPLVLVVPAAHALAKKARVPVKALDRMTFIATPRELAPALHDAIASVFAQNNVRLQQVEGADNVLGQLNLVQAGLGVALIPDYVRAILPPGVVMKPLVVHPVPTVGIYLVKRREASLAALDSFTTLVLECCRG
jgi:LysR family hca operon transcriptional activator